MIRHVCAAIMLLVMLSSTAQAQKAGEAEMNILQLQKLARQWNLSRWENSKTDDGSIRIMMQEDPDAEECYMIRVVQNGEEEVLAFELSVQNGNMSFLEYSQKMFRENDEVNRNELLRQISEVMQGVPGERKTFTLANARCGLICTAGGGTLRVWITDPDAVEYDFSRRPGVDGSNAYDIINTLEALGFTIGGRQVTSDGYLWTCTGVSSYGSYAVTVDANKFYEIHQANITHAGNDVIFLTWAATLPFDQADVDETVAWIRSCQTERRAGELVTGDAIWRYQPHTNGQSGGTLTITDEAAEAYSDYLLGQLLGD